MNKMTDLYNFDQLIRQARVERSAAIASTLVDIALAVNSGVKRVLHGVAPGAHKVQGSRQTT